jgi:hypothetical protein
VDYRRLTNVTIKDAYPIPHTMSRSISWREPSGSVLQTWMLDTGR